MNEGQGRECGNCRRLGVGECRLEGRGEGPHSWEIGARSPPCLRTRVNAPPSAAPLPWLTKEQRAWCSGHRYCPV